jgi:hypothetical protein
MFPFWPEGIKKYIKKVQYVSELFHPWESLNIYLPLKLKNDRGAIGCVRQASWCNLEG